MKVPTLGGSGTGAPPFSLEGRREAVAGTNCVNASRARIICVRAAK